jgi:RNA polymerase sigma-70 factor (ECF subfamily)
VQLNEWIRKAQDGNEAAMERLIVFFQDAVWRRARYRLGDHDEAWDVTQETFILCFRKIGQYRGEAPFWAWLSRIVENQIKNRRSWWRRRRREQTFSLDEMGGGDPESIQKAWDPPDPSPSPRQQAAGREELALLDRALGTLRVEHREVMLLRFSDGLSYEEIAQTLGLSLGTVKSRINRARQDLKNLMQDRI